MNATGGLNGRLTRLAVGRHLPHRTVRLRLTLLYGGLFLFSGAALMVIAYALLVNAGFVFTLHNGAAPESNAGRTSVATVPQGLPIAGSTTHPSTQTMAYWRGVAQCMHERGVSSFPEPRASVPSQMGGVRNVSDRDGAILVFPATLNTQSGAFVDAASVCGFAADSAQQVVQDNRQRTDARKELLLQSGIALAGMSLLSLGLGWLMAGRVLQPLETSYEAQRQFVANASHELRAPLARQKALIQVALAEPDASAGSLRAAHERVLASEQQLEEIIEGLLTLTRGHAGLEHREHLNLATLTSQAVLARGAEFGSLGLEVRTNLLTAPMAGDARLVERLIANLLDNAIRHNTPGGYVEITTGALDWHAFLVITNSGQAVPTDQIHRLFRPFERLAGARTRHDGGHGLGLSIVQAIADGHGAELRADARSDGGLTIDVSFPPAFGAAPARRPQARLIDLRRSGRRSPS